MIPISKLKFTTEEERAVLRVLRSGQLTQNEQVKKFEEEFARYIGTKYAVAVSNGTTALHLALLSLGISKGDEVITTPFSFIASTNAILYVGAKPVFVDIGDDYNINPSLIEEKITPRTKAILIVHLYGNPCDMEKIMRIAKKHKLFLIEDSAQAHGAEYRGEKVGGFGDVGCFSFYATKNMTTGEGGMITTNSLKLYNYMVMVRNHGSLARYYHKLLGYNFRMTEVQATIGRVQLTKLNNFNKKRIIVANTYTSALKSVPGLITPKNFSQGVSVFHQYTIRIKKSGKKSRKKLIKELQKNKIGYSIYYPIPIHQQESIINLGIKARCPNAEECSQEVLSLPISPYLTKNEQNYIIQTVINALS